MEFRPFRQPALATSGSAGALSLGRNNQVDLGGPPAKSPPSGGGKFPGANRAGAAGFPRSIIRPFGPPRGRAAR